MENKKILVKQEVLYTNDRPDEGRTNAAWLAKYRASVGVDIPVLREIHRLFDSAPAAPFHLAAVQGAVNDWINGKVTASNQGQHQTTARSVSSALDNAQGVYGAFARERGGFYKRTAFPDKDVLTEKKPANGGAATTATTANA